MNSLNKVLIQISVVYDRFSVIIIVHTDENGCIIYSAFLYSVFVSCIIFRSVRYQMSNKQKVTIAVTVASVAVISVACAVWLKLRKDKKEIGGELVKVNYKFEKEF